MQNELKQTGHISNENRERWQLINKGWQAMVRVLQDENHQNDPFSPVFRKQVWQRIWADASAALDKIEPLPLPE